VGLATRDPLHRRPLGQSAVIVLGGWFAVNSLTRIVLTLPSNPCGTGFQ